tara:strand:- start:110 stop:364 length:255 start_codon:yes stop_codon:yes gene_type:complete
MVYISSLKGAKVALKLCHGTRLTEGVVLLNIRHNQRREIHQTQRRGQNNERSHRLKTFLNKASLFMAYVSKIAYRNTLMSQHMT